MKQPCEHGRLTRLRCTAVLTAVMLSGGCHALDASRRAVIARIAAGATTASTAPALADRTPTTWPPDDAFGRPPPRGWSSAASDAVLDAARDTTRQQRDTQRESALRELAEQQRFQDDRLRRCEEEVEAWQDCFFLDTKPSRRRGPATW